MVFAPGTLEQVQVFFWVFARVSVILFLLPLFGARGVPTLWKVGVSFVLAIILAPVVPVPRVFPGTPIEMTLAMVCEIVMGLLLSFGIRLVFASVQMAGQFMAFQMGFAMARAMDPISGAQSTVLSQFLYLFAVLLFFVLDGHHLFIRALVSSFYIVGPNAFSFHPALSEILIRISGGMFLVALKIAAPIMAAMFLSNLCLGIVARTVPQLNILMVGFPINLSIGLVLFGLLLTAVPPYMAELFKGAAELFARMVRLM